MASAGKQIDWHLSFPAISHGQTASRLVSALATSTMKRRNVRPRRVQRRYLRSSITISRNDDAAIKGEGLFFSVDNDLWAYDSTRYTRCSSHYSSSIAHSPRSASLCRDTRL